MSGIGIVGTGAVSPAGWNASALWDAVERGAPLPCTDHERPGWRKPLPMSSVPKPESPPSFARHPRLRRTAPIGRFAAAAAVEALAGAPDFDASNRRMGIVFCSTCGCVSYSRRFYQEVLDDPPTASPVLFPETVFNAPASHLSALFDNPGANYTLIGDAGVVAQGLALGAAWLLQDRVDACLVVASEEADWIVADALRKYSRSLPLAEGAGAILLARSAAAPVKLSRITDVQRYSEHGSRSQATRAVAEQLGGGDGETVLCAGTLRHGGLFRAEREAWADWPGRTIEVKPVAGEALSAGAMWQCVLAARALQSEGATRAQVSLAGNFEFAVGVEFKR